MMTDRDDTENQQSIAIGTYDDLGPDNPERFIPDPNPTIPCGVCGESFPFKKYWEPRVIDGERVTDPRNETWRCDDCEQTKNRGEQNESLDQYVEVL
jgi:hypothetical protein